MRSQQFIPPLLKEKIHIMYQSQMLMIFIYKTRLIQICMELLLRISIQELLIMSILLPREMENGTAILSNMHKWSQFQPKIWPDLLKCPMVKDSMLLITTICLLLNKKANTEL